MKSYMQNENLNGTELQHLPVNGRSIPELQGIYARLEQIKHFMEREAGERQLTIDKQSAKIEKLKLMIAKKDEIITTLENQLKECSRNIEGNRQLINKLLNDISHYQNDIEWYKRTYEKRSLWGVVKEKLNKKK